MQEDQRVSLLAFDNEVAHLLKGLQKVEASRRNPHYLRLGGILSGFAQKLPRLTFLRKVVDLGDTLLGLQEYRCASRLCYSLCLQQSENKMKGEDSQSALIEVTTRATFGVAVAQFAILRQCDPGLEHSTTLQRALDEIAHVQKAVEDALAVDAHAWLVYNGTVHIFTMSVPLVTAGHAGEVLPFLLFCVLSLETCVPLMVGRYLSWRVQLYLLVHLCYREMGEPEEAHKFLQRCVEQVNEMRAVEEGDDSEFRPALARLYDPAVKELTVELFQYMLPGAPVPSSLTDATRGGEKSDSLGSEAATPTRGKKKKKEKESKHPEFAMGVGAQLAMTCGPEAEQLKAVVQALHSGTRRPLEVARAHPVVSPTHVSDLLERARDLTTMGSTILNVPMTTCLSLVRIAFAHEDWVLFDAVHAAAISRLSADPPADRTLTRRGALLELSIFDLVRNLRVSEQVSKDICAHRKAAAEDVRTSSSTPRAKEKEKDAGKGPATKKHARRPSDASGGRTKKKGKGSDSDKEDKDNKDKDKDSKDKDKDSKDKDMDKVKDSSGNPADPQSTLAKEASFRVSTLSQLGAVVRTCAVPDFPIDDVLDIVTDAGLLLIECASHLCDHDNISALAGLLDRAEKPPTGDDDVSAGGEALADEDSVPPEASQSGRSLPSTLVTFRDISSVHDLDAPSVEERTHEMEELKVELWGAAYEGLRAVSLPDPIVLAGLALNLGNALTNSKNARVACAVLQSAVDAMAQHRERHMLLSSRAYNMLPDAYQQQLHCLHADLISMLFRVELQQDAAIKAKRSGNQKRPVVRGSSPGVERHTRHGLKALLMVCRKSLHHLAMVHVEQARVATDRKEQLAHLQEAMTALDRAQEKEAALERATRPPASPPASGMPAPLLRSRTSSSVLLVLPSSMSTCERCVCFAKAVGSGTAVTSSNTEFIGTGETVERGENGDFEFIISGLEANEEYIFAVARVDSSGRIGRVGACTTEIVTACSLPLLYCWGQLADVASELQHTAPTKRASLALYNAFVEKKEDRPLWQQHPMDAHVLKRHLLSTAPSPVRTCLALALFRLAALAERDVFLMRPRPLRHAIPVDVQLARLRLSPMLSMAVEVAVSLDDPALILDAALRLTRLLAPLVALADPPVEVLLPLVAAQRALTLVPPAMLGGAQVTRTIKMLWFQVVDLMKNVEKKSGARSLMSMELLPPQQDMPDESDASHHLTEKDAVDSPRDLERKKKTKKSEKKPLDKLVFVPDSKLELLPAALPEDVAVAEHWLVVGAASTYPPALLQTREGKRDEAIASAILPLVAEARGNRDPDRAGMPALEDAVVILRRFDGSSGGQPHPRYLEFGTRIAREAMALGAPDKAFAWSDEVLVKTRTYHETVFTSSPPPDSARGKKSDGGTKKKTHKHEGSTGGRKEIKKGNKRSNKGSKAPPTAESVAAAALSEREYAAATSIQTIVPQFIARARQQVARRAIWTCESPWRAELHRVRGEALFERWQASNQAPDGLHQPGFGPGWERWFCLHTLGSVVDIAPDLFVPPPVEEEDPQASTPKDDKKKKNIPKDDKKKKSAGNGKHEKDADPHQRALSRPALRVDAEGTPDSKLRLTLLENYSRSCVLAARCHCWSQLMFTVGRMWAAVRNVIPPVDVRARASTHKPLLRATEAIFEMLLHAKSGGAVYDANFRPALNEFTMSKQVRVAMAEDDDDDDDPREKEWFDDVKDLNVRMLANFVQYTAQALGNAGKVHILIDVARTLHELTDGCTALSLLPYAVKQAQRHGLSEERGALERIVRTLSKQPLAVEYLQGTRRLLAQHLVTRAGAAGQREAARREHAGAQYDGHPMHFNPLDMSLASAVSSHSRVSSAAHLHTNLTREHTPEFIATIASYEKTIEFLRQKRTRDLASQALHELGNVLVDEGEIAAGVHAWLEGVDNTFGVLNASRTWRTIVEEHDANNNPRTAEAHGMFGCLMAALLLGKVAAARRNDLAGRLDLASFAAYLIRATFVGNLAHPTRLIDFALYDPKQLWLDCPLFDDPWWFTPGDLIAAIDFISVCLVDEAPLEALPVLSLYLHVTRDLCADLRGAARASLLRARALLNIGRPAAVVDILQDVASGLGFARGVLDAQAQTSRVTFVDSFRPHHPSNEPAVKLVAEHGDLPGPLSELFGPVIRSEYDVVRASLLVLLARADDSVSCDDEEGNVAMLVEREHRKKSRDKDKEGKSPRNSRSPRSKDNSRGKDKDRRRSVAPAMLGSVNSAYLYQAAEVLLDSVEMNAGLEADAGASTSPAARRIGTRCHLLRASALVGRYAFTGANEEARSALRICEEEQQERSADRGLDAWHWIESKVLIVRGLLDAGLLEECMEHAEEAARDVSAVNEVRRGQVLEVAQVYVHLRRGEDRTAIDLLQTAVCKCREQQHPIPRPGVFTVALVLWGDLLMKQGSLVQAIDVYKEARRSAAAELAVVNHDHAKLDLPTNTYLYPVPTLVKVDLRLSRALGAAHLVGLLLPPTRAVGGSAGAAGGSNSGGQGSAGALEEAVEVANEAMSLVAKTVGGTPLLHAEALLALGTARALSTKLRGKGALAGPGGEEHGQAASIEEAAGPVRSAVRMIISTGGHDRPLLRAGLLMLADLHLRRTGGNPAHIPQACADAFECLVAAAQVSRMMACLATATTTLPSIPGAVLRDCTSMPAFAMADITGRTTAEVPVAPVGKRESSPRSAGRKKENKSGGFASPDGTVIHASALLSYFVALIRSGDVPHFLSDDVPARVTEVHTFLCSAFEPYLTQCCFRDIPSCVDPPPPDVNALPPALIPQDAAVFQWMVPSFVVDHSSPRAPRPPSSTSRRAAGRARRPVKAANASTRAPVCLVYMIAPPGGEKAPEKAPPKEKHKGRGKAKDKSASSTARDHDVVVAESAGGEPEERQLLFGLLQFSPTVIEALHAAILDLRLVVSIEETPSAEASKVVRKDERGPRKKSVSKEKKKGATAGGTVPPQPVPLSLYSKDTEAKFAAVLECVEGTLRSPLNVLARQMAVEEEEGAEEGKEEDVRLSVERPPLCGATVASLAALFDMEVGLEGADMKVSSWLYALLGT